MGLYAFNSLSGTALVGLGVTLTACGLMRMFLLPGIGVSETHLFAGAAACFLGGIACFVHNAVLNLEMARRKLIAAREADAERV